MTADAANHTRIRTMRATLHLARAVNHGPEATSGEIQTFMACTGPSHVG